MSSGNVPKGHATFLQNDFDCCFVIFANNHLNCAPRVADSLASLGTSWVRLHEVDDIVAVGAKPVAGRRRSTAATPCWSPFLSPLCGDGEFWWGNNMVNEVPQKSQTFGVQNSLKCNDLGLGRAVTYT